VVLADLSPVLLEQARARIRASNLQDRVESVDEVNAEDLGRYVDGSFDAVLAFGPFYHLVSEAERLRAAREIGRVLRPAGVAILAIMPRASGVAGLIERAAARPDQVSAETLRIAASTGVFRNATAGGFQEGYYPRPGEIEALLGVAGLAVQKTISLRSVAYRLEDGLSKLSPSVRYEAENVMDSMSSLPEVIASGGHALVIARREPVV
jgi:SAM-dependent methyltransferase